MTVAEKQKLLRKLKAFMKENFSFRNTWGESYGVYFDYDYLRYNGPVADASQVSRSSIKHKKNRKAVWNTLFKDLEEVINKL